jgi:hypothetical protein
MNAQKCKSGYLRALIGIQRQCSPYKEAQDTPIVNARAQTFNEEEEEETKYTKRKRNKKYLTLLLICLPLPLLVDFFVLTTP